MRLPRSRLVLALAVIAAIVVASAITAAVGLSTGGGVGLGPVRQTGPPPRITPEIVRFDGQRFVRCRTAGAAVRVEYKYATIRASSVEGRIDGVSRGVLRAGSTDRGTMRFRYVCPGPHTFTITARAPGGTATQSIRFNKRNHAVGYSASGSAEVQASP